MIICAGVLFSLWTLSCGLFHSKHTLHPGSLTEQEKAVQIYFKDQTLPCENYIDLGHIQASSGEELEQGDEQEGYATFDAAIAWLKKEAHERGASGVIIIDRKVSKDKISYLVTGTAIRCEINRANVPLDSAAQQSPDSK